MTLDTSYKSGKSEHDENFPVASWFIAPRHRPPILAFYRFARAADDAADSASLSPSSKLAILAALENTLLGKTNEAADALPLRDALRSRNLSSQHALDLLQAFRQDVTKSRYDTWADLIEYCRYSAMPVGRFVLDVHGEPISAWRASDALCTALQIINHLQDCAKDYNELDRVYLPLADLSAYGAGIEALGQRKASPELLACLHLLADRTSDLLAEAALLPSGVNDLRLSVETAAIVALARKLLRLLKSRDPLADRVHLSKSGAATVVARAAAVALVLRARGRRTTPSAAEDRAA
jgi:squalene synthase HpnC